MTLENPNLDDVIEQLSIDSKTDTKIQMNNSQASQSPNEMCNMSSEDKQTMTSNTPKAHFRIDWRQLTYFKKENRTRTCQLFSGSAGVAPKHTISSLSDNKLEQQSNQLDESLYDFEYDSRCGGGGADDDDDEDEREFSQRDAVSSRLSQNLESGRASRSSYQPAATPTGRNHRQAILNSLDGCFRSGQLSAILGPSGAGKSTFLSALFGNKQESSFGQTRVTWFSEPNSAVNTKRSIRIASLPQQDHLLNHLTVYEALMFASKIKNPHQRHSPTDSFHRINVKRVAKTLKLTECLQTRCGRLSGGQYKRVSIAQELLSEPDVIILDEPTSGLDALTCLTTIRTLKSIVTKHPISIILTIHQPDIDVFNLFDHVYVIAQGGLAIYEGPPDGVAPTLAQVGLTMPDRAYNPARFIVENAFVSAPEDSFGNEMGVDQVMSAANKLGSDLSDVADGINSASAHSDELDEDEPEDDGGDAKKLGVAEFLRQSLSSIAAALKPPDQDGGLKASPTSGCSPPPNKSGGLKQRFRDSGRQPLLQIGIQTADGKLITRNQLNGTTTTTASSTIGAGSRAATLNRSGAGAGDHWEFRRKVQERLRVLRRLNGIQKGRYYKDGADHNDQLAAESSFTCESDLLSQPSVSLCMETNRKRDGGQSLDSGHQLGQSNVSSACSSAPSSTSSSWSIARDQLESADTGGRCRHREGEEAGGQRATPPAGLICELTVAAAGDKQACRGSPSTAKCETITTTASNQLQNGMFATPTGRAKKLRRQFDKRLSSKRFQTRDHTVWYHTFLLTHRTWLSIVRDPVFFGIQFAMHTTIPILLAMIFGSHQEEGCPKAGHFDLVEFAYLQDGAHFLQDSMQSLRKSIGNIGVVFFEMFVLSFAINCITALVFPLDMHVLLKEHRNGWYSMTSYFFGRTLADLPVPVVLHSMAMSILCYMTGQPLSSWRFMAVLGIVIVASLVAQSVGLTIGALLMRSSQSAVLAAAGIVAPFFALSGFIVRIHTLPLLAQWAAQGSYLYHLINGFIIMRYGFDRCSCSPDDFVKNEAHEIPQNLRTMASIWIGTYSNEFESEKAKEWDQLRIDRHQVNRTNLDPNIDIIDKLLDAFRMASSYGHKVDDCNDVLPYAMLDFNLRDSDLFHCISSLIIMLLVTRFITFSAIYYKIRSFS